MGVFFSGVPAFFGRTTSLACCGVVRDFSMRRRRTSGCKCFGGTACFRMYPLFGRCPPDAVTGSVEVILFRPFPAAFLLILLSDFFFLPTVAAPLLAAFFLDGVLDEKRERLNRASAALTWSTTVCFFFLVSETIFRAGPNDFRVVFGIYSTLRGGGGLVADCLDLSFRLIFRSVRGLGE